MSVVVIVWAMVAAACLTLAAVHFPVWWRNRDARASLAFAVAAIATAVVAGCELVMLTAQTPGEYGQALRWLHVPIFLLFVSLAAFAYHYLEAGRWWLAFTAIGLRLISLIINFNVGENLNLLEISSLRYVRLLGETVALPVGLPNPWQVLAQLSTYLLAIFFADAAVTAWRRGRRTAAVFVGGSLAFYMFAGTSSAILVYWYGADLPRMLSLFSLGIVLIMGYALSADLLRAKQMVGDLLEREQEANLSAEAAKLGTWSRDIVRDSISASRKWRELFGFSPSEPIVMDELMRRVHADDRVAFHAKMTDPEKQHGDYQAEFRLMLPDGTMRWVAALGRVEFDARGNALRSRGACVDITASKTASKRAEQEMLRLRQDIAHVGRVSLMGQLSATLAHEISQPLGAILRNAEAAALFLQDDSPDLHEIRAIVEDIRKDDQRAGQVIDRMRALLRREELAMAPLTVTQLLGDVAALLHPDAVSRHVALELVIPADLPAVQGDRVQVQQVLLNLILNAMDALEGVTESSRSVRVTARREGDASVEISVVDSGRGIAADQMERIFDPFFTTKSKGMGMGLAISRSIVETHGGRLWAESNAGNGATFRFTLPNVA